MINNFLIIIPAFNEESGITNSITSIFKFLDSNNFEHVKVLVVNDGSTDSTKEKILQILEIYSNRLILINHDFNKGYGAANITGVYWALKNNISYSLFMDADLTQDPIYIKDFYHYILSGYDVIKATRYSKGGSTVGVPFIRWIISFIGNKFAKICYRKEISDYTNGFRAIKNSLLQDLKPCERGFAYIMEEMKYLSSKRDLNWVEVPYVLSVRSSKYSKSSFVYNPKVFWNYLKHLF